MLKHGMEADEASTTHVSKSSLASVQTCPSNHARVFNATEYQEGNGLGKYPQTIPFNNVHSLYHYMSKRGILNDSSWNQESKKICPPHLLHSKNEEQINVCLSRQLDITVLQTEKVESLSVTQIFEYLWCGNRHLF